LPRQEASSDRENFSNGDARYEKRSTNLLPSRERRDEIGVAIQIANQDIAVQYHLDRGEAVLGAFHCSRIRRWYCTGFSCFFRLSNPAAASQLFGNGTRRSSISLSLTILALVEVFIH
jgi:hypothetical protein